MDWFLYDNGLRHERVDHYPKAFLMDFKLRDFVIKEMLLRKFTVINRKTI